MNRMKKELTQPNASKCYDNNLQALGSAALKALVLSVFAYPLVVVMVSMTSLFQNRPFSFAGYELSVILTESSASAGISVKPEFFISIIVLFAVSTLVIWGIGKLLTVRKMRA